MSTINSISNYLSTNWYSHPVSHLDQTGKVKPFKLYKQEVRQSLSKIYEEHEKIIEHNQLGLIYRSISFMGKVLSFNYSSKELFNVEYFYKSQISPIDHYDNNGLKSKAQFKQELKVKLGEIYEYHLAMEKFENSTYTELAFNKFGESVSKFCSLELIEAASSLATALFYASAGILKIISNFEIFTRVIHQEDSQQNSLILENEMVSYDMVSIGDSDNIIDI